MSSTDSTRKTILAVDDDPHILEVLEVRLVSAGYDVVTATDGLEALEVLSKQPVRLVISDIRMPGMSGTRLQEEMERRGLRLPIIFLTAHGSIPGAVEAIKHGAVDYLTKPFDGQELLARVTEVFAKAAGAEPDRNADLSDSGLVGKSQAMTTRCLMYPTGWSGFAMVESTRSRSESNSISPWAPSAPGRIEPEWPWAFVLLPGG